ncbi:MAG: hypothetical protein Ct9H300mP27_10610 [Chloroflexota bacterium]|nr:MAG: hypothetical protein Ct9H300mP27_10610 [Chloroflexota bacterium]
MITTTGMISREVFDIHDRTNNFYMLGSMGLLSSFGLGLAITFPDKRIWILEGDGSALMSLGTLPLIASESPKNIVHLYWIMSPTNPQVGNHLSALMYHWNK